VLGPGWELWVSVSVMLGGLEALLWGGGDPGSGWEMWQCCQPGDLQQRSGTHGWS